MLIVPRPGAVQNRLEPQRPQNPRSGTAGDPEPPEGLLPGEAQALPDGARHRRRTAVPALTVEAVTDHDRPQGAIDGVRHGAAEASSGPHPAAAVRPVPRKVVNESSCASHQAVWWIGASLPVHGEENPRSR